MVTVQFDVNPPEKPSRWKVVMDGGETFEGKVMYGVDGQSFVKPPASGWPRRHPHGAIKPLA